MPARGHVRPWRVHTRATVPVMRGRCTYCPLTVQCYVTRANARTAAFRAWCYLGAGLGAGLALILGGLMLCP